MVKFLSQPLKDFRVFQKFGENTACVDANDKVISQNLNGTCPPGFVKLYEKLGLKGHNGIDCFAPRWTPVYASHAGKILSATVQGGFGLGVELMSDKSYAFFADCHETHYAKTRYWHLISVNVDKGQTVRTGDLLGYCDSTGLSSGDHLHFDLKASDENGTTLHSDNGYFGVCDPIPYMDSVFAGTIKTVSEKLAEIAAKLADIFADWARYKGR